MNASPASGSAKTTTDGHAPDSGVLARTNGAAAVVTLDRPKALNALNAAMRAAIMEAIRPLVRDPQIYALVLRSNSQKAFCAGGDVRELTAWGISDPARAREAFEKEYRLDWALDCFSKPSVSLADGFVMGSGAGLTLYNTHRVGGDRYAFAMPETAIGFFPDVGAARVLGRLPDHIGLYLGLTGRRIGRDDAYHLGLLTHLISADRFDDVEAQLAEAWPIDDVLDARHQEPGPSELDPYRETIAQCFGAPSMEEICDRLAAVTGPHAAWASQVRDELDAKSPTALKVSLRHIRQAARLDLRNTLIQDYRLALAFLGHPDFAEGVRAVLVDKDNQPSWRPASLQNVPDADVEAFFEEPTDGDLTLASREEMQNMRNAVELW